jgi:uncharacterized protein
LRIPVEDIPEGVSTLELKCDAEEIDLEEEGVSFAGPITVGLKLFKQNDRIYLKADLLIPIESKCAKCLTTVHGVVKGAFENQYRPLPKETRYVMDDIGIRYYSDEYIDLSDDVKESFFLELPTRIVCSEDCKGLCPKCGQNLNEVECSCCLQPEEVQTSKLADMIKMLEIDKKLEV